ncbi:MAG: cyclic nucleotide-binding domain-containing protein [Actinobacteria bacterium]|nr:MAG: cyclic nucleotide-binding domain-containing protein [Actinomycetota bacterium]
MGLIESAGEVRSYADGETVFLEGAAGEHLFIVLKGTVRIWKGGDLVATTLGELGPGTMFGEQSLIDGRPHCANAEAVGDTELVLYDKAAFLDALRDEPELALRVIESMCARLRATTDVLQKLCDQYVLDKAELALTQKAILECELS